MSYLDNLENNLKALENQEEKDPEKIKRDHERRESERTAALATAPHLDALKTSPFTSELLTQCRAIGRGQRVLVQFCWLGNTLRLDARNRRMELIPTAEGIVAVLSTDGEVIETSRIDPNTQDATALASRWLNDQADRGT